MQAIPKSGYTLPNRLGRITLESIEELVSTKGMERLLSLAHLQDRIGAYPPANLEKGFDFAEMSALILGLEEFYGPRGGRGAALRAGRAVFSSTLSHFGTQAGVEAVVFRMLPVTLRIKLGLKVVARFFNDFSDQTCRVEDKQHELYFIVNPNAICWSRTGEEKSVCFLMVGILQEALNRISGGHEYRVDEVECLAASGSQCEFAIQKEPIN